MMLLINISKSETLVHEFQNESYAESAAVKFNFSMKNCSASDPLITKLLQRSVTQQLCLLQTISYADEGETDCSLMCTSIYSPDLFCSEATLRHAST